MTHTSTEQPAINELCQWFNEGDGFKQGTAAPHKWVLQANSEISRQHARIAELESQLSAIGAGGVEPLRKSAPAPAPNERAAFEAWLRVKPCGAAHDFGWAAWQARAALAATHPTQHGLEQFIEQTGDVHFQRCRVGSKEGEIRWDVEFGHYGAEVRGKTLRDAITKAMAVQTKKEGE